MRDLLLGFTMISAAIAFAADNAKEQQAQQRADAPVLGYSWAEQSRELRAILGVPGASRWSEPIALPEGITALRIAPGHSWALAMLEDGGVAALGLDALTLTRFESIRGSFDAVEFSPSGSAVALRNTETGEINIFRGAPASPNRIASLNTRGAIAVSDNGTVAYLSEDRLMTSSSSSQNPSFIMACTSTCRFGFFPETDSIVVLAQTGRLMEITDSGSTRLIAESLASAALLAASAKSITLADGATLRFIDRDSGILVANTESAAPITRLLRMRHPESWLLGDSESEPLWMHSLEGIRFVPARPVAPADAQQEVKE